ncbi:MAG: hypothetical protein SchgKO_11040 [Schleiferiaceae bacterium]
MKKTNSIIIVISLIISILVVLVFQGGKNLSDEAGDWGHHVELINDLDLDIDSVRVRVGDEVTFLGPDLQGIISVPESGYPHAVEFVVFSPGQMIALPADSFDCFQCDGYHYYTLTWSGGTYEFRP